MAICSLGLDVRRDFLVKPDIVYTVTKLSEYPTSSRGLHLGVKREEVPGLVELKYGVVVDIRSAGKKSATNVQARVTAAEGSYIVQVHTDDDRLTQRLPDIGRQGSSEVFITIPLMVPGEKVKLTFWYGIPDKPEIEPGPPKVLVRHTEGLGKVKTTV